MTSTASMRPRHAVDRSLATIAVTFSLVTPDVEGASRVSADATVRGVSMASDDVQPGDLFVAVPGARVHGARFAADAVGAGAAAVVTDAAGVAVLGDLVRRVPVLVTEDPRALAGPLAADVLGRPAERLTTVGVTGTNGKTTTTYFVDAALRAAHASTAVLGTVELRIGEDAIESPRTTVEAPVLHGVLALALERGATAVAMEVSSHALALHRVAGTTFDVVGFTNLQRDHLDFHGDMEGYFRDKARLFAPGQARRGVVVVDDEWGARLAREAQIPVESVATHVGDPAAADADWAVVSADVGLDGVGSTFVLRGPDGARHDAVSPLPGLVNVSNAALAIVLAHAAGVDLQVAIGAVATAHAIPGRMERVIERAPGRALALVDYAHTPDALVLALEAVRPITPGRLVIVFGSDGDRDRGKRPIMGEIAARLADVLVVTDENPRSEDPASIRAAILDGVRTVRPDLTDVLEVEPRAEAVRRGVALAREGDTVIVTGKGHEPTQEIAGVFHRYNDRDVLLAVRDESAGGHA
ncbi:UDP-N-acetylmuramoyl-L-alanyl-D-glutamate--2,6-diaminopimelate ligase [Cellulomonas sp.]|uniref:UDP-N-acetylmuramoyl-L-alanyl-D-glutamate--2, 6-diaminopimelate ligase n=1 Tax=Cellulomonas sp. TaxID=40001 RepID=UPI002584DB68|nr:UDP-N-acetylmuramoyl-L-alanyl-D-glutamate--2,6-diaminopimelate ligase [Cellulomonas sp.]MCR6689738.1 UDP-N-acetylmuramoyl-L-alanyl-D-glutamate--2,6-diaminopimelate ligase [Cellulomonas sp.]